MFMKSLWSGGRFAILFSIVLTAFTAYALLDTFVIPRRYAAVPSQEEASAAPLKEEVPAPQINENASASSDGAVSPSEGTRRRHGKNRSVAETDNASPGTSENAQSSGTRSWSEENVSITLTQYRAYDTDVYVADVTLNSPEYLKTAFAGNVYGRNVKDKTSAIAAENNAVLAINGDYYGARNSGYVIRDGVLYRESGAGGDVLSILADGSFRIDDDRQVTARELLEAGATQTFSFGPALLKDGEITVTKGQEVGKAMVSNPRTAIGVVGKLHYVFVVADGRTERSAGMSLYELADFLRGLGVETAYNLDGGGSSTMVFNGEIVNHPTTSGNSVKERSVSDIVYIGS